MKSNATKDQQSGVLRYEKEHGLSRLVNTKARREYAWVERQGINEDVAALWTKDERDRGLKHWSGLSLAYRVKKLDAQYQEVYATHYAGLSWQVHAGLTGVTNLKRETYLSMCVQTLDLSMRFYEDAQKAIIKEFRLLHHDPKMLDKLRFARLVPFTKSQEDIDELKRDLGL